MSKVKNNERAIKSIVDPEHPFLPIMVLLTTRSISPERSAAYLKPGTVTISSILWTQRHSLIPMIWEICGIKS